MQERARKGRKRVGWAVSNKSLTVVSESVGWILVCSSLHFSRKEARILFFFSSPLVFCTLSMRPQTSWKGTSAATSLGRAPLGPGVAIAGAPETWNCMLRGAFLLLPEALKRDRELIPRSKTVKEAFKTHRDWQVNTNCCSSPCL